MALQKPTPVTTSPGLPIHRHVSDSGEGVKRKYLNREHWSILNRLRTGVGRYRSSIKKWGMQTVQHVSVVDHIIKGCPLHIPPSDAAFFEVGPQTRPWLQHTELTIYERRGRAQQLPKSCACWMIYSKDHPCAHGVVNFPCHTKQPPQ